MNEIKEKKDKLSGLSEKDIKELVDVLKKEYEL